MLNSYHSTNLLFDSEDAEKFLHGHQYLLFVFFALNIKLLMFCRFANITKASDHVQNAIRTRMKKYPNDWSDLMHYTHLLVPKNLQYVLENAKSVNLISKAIRLFYHRDHIDLKVCRLLKQMNPKSEQLELVKVGLNLTKCLYAMLSKVDFS